MKSRFAQPTTLKLLVRLTPSFRLILTMVFPVLLPAATPAAGISEQALVARSGPRGATMFRAMPASETGIVTENNYSDPTMWAERHRELELGALGTGVAIGDYDGDGRPDIFVVSKTEGSRMFRNLGGWKFADVTVTARVADVGEAAGIWKQGVTFADVNNDGWLDLYVCRFAAPNLLYMNQGDGTFREEAASRGLAVMDASVMAAFCDFDRDGWLDVLLQTNLLDEIKHPQGQRNYLFKNKGDGIFVDVSEPAGISGEAQGHSVAWWDYNHDGWPDLYVANDFAPEDKLYRNNRDGTFSNVIDQAVPHTPASSMGSDQGDINNDGLIDLLVADMAATTHEKDHRGMAATRGMAVDPVHPSLAPQYPRNALYLATGTDRCLEAAYLTGLEATDWTWSVRFEDLDNDGRLDLHVTNGMINESHNSDLLGRLMLAQNPAEKVRITKASPRLVEENLAFRNLGDLRFESVGSVWGLNERGVSFGAAFGDLDGDGDLDLVYANYQKGVTVLRNDAETGHRVVFALRGTRSNRFGVGARVRIETEAGGQVRQLVLARGVLSNSEPVLHFGLGEEERINRVTVEWPSGQTQELTDLAADRKYTLTEPAGPGETLLVQKPASRGQFTDMSQAAGLSVLSREFMFDELVQQPLLPSRQNQRGPGLAVGDTRVTGRADIVVGGTARDPAKLLHAGSDGRFTTSEIPFLATVGPLSDGPLLLFEANGDGHPDLLVTKGGSARPAGSAEFQPRLLYNDGTGVFQPAPPDRLPPLPFSVGALAAADFNRDGQLDLIIGARVLPGLYPLTPRSALLVNRGGRFEDITEIIAPGLREAGMVTAALWSDVDRDGWPDLLLTIEWGQVLYFHNRGGQAFENWTDRAGFATGGTGWWNSIAAADFNRDGRSDFVVGNVGLNTQYRADATHPALLFAGDFKGDGTMQLVEGYFEKNRMLPRRSRKALGASIPAILKRLNRNDYFARATLPEILGDKDLAAAQRFAATELRSGVFLSQPDETYRFTPLPRLAQIAPINGLSAGDFDGDGCADIYAVQNSFAPVPAVGRMDGGLSLLLRGDGAGQFAAVPPGESHLLVAGDAKALAVLDFDQDGWPDFLITRNNGTTLAYRNNGLPGRNSLCISLRGSKGNPAAVGARISLRLSNGRWQSAEIYAGSGYYSQSASSVFFGWPEGIVPQEISVVWPTGDVTNLPVPKNPETTWRIDAP
ncbi:FG-GAP repeat protein [Lacunisphaera limnophila]|uniref:FG-GAP repeat protein n=1 Tax=Lacunisphaera limnophila TaxID=1838286 RepID=A0A1D8ATU8_9BACT|nr:FG-GAP-like repeat-containing protein [Lacunisphaera limnophila]AOS44319.1 FG-GAP repeat protein [Lacunisphaera limnophila]